jgi:hypothetical protein
VCGKAELLRVISHLPHCPVAVDDLVFILRTTLCPCTLRSAMSAPAASSAELASAAPAKSSTSPKKSQAIAAIIRAIVEPMLKTLTINEQLHIYIAKLDERKLQIPWDTAQKLPMPLPSSRYQLRCVVRDEWVGVRDGERQSPKSSVVADEGGEKSSGDSSVEEAQVSHGRR